jgi:hypothetical protein
MLKNINLPTHSCNLQLGNRYWCFQNYLSLSINFARETAQNAVFMYSCHHLIFYEFVIWMHLRIYF